MSARSEACAPSTTRFPSRACQGHTAPTPSRSCSASTARPVPSARPLSRTPCRAKTAHSRWLAPPRASTVRWATSAPRPCQTRRSAAPMAHTRWAIRESARSAPPASLARTSTATRRCGAPSGRTLTRDRRSVRPARPATSAPTRRAPRRCGRARRASSLATARPSARNAPPATTRQPWRPSRRPPAAHARLGRTRAALVTRRQSRAGAVRGVPSARTAHRQSPLTAPQVRSQPPTATCVPCRHRRPHHRPSRLSHQAHLRHRRHAQRTPSARDTPPPLS